MKKSAGFTLVELMVVVAIIAIIAGTAGPAIIKYLNNRGVHDAANQLLADLHKIRSRSIKERVNATITFNQSTNQYQADLTDPSTGTSTTLAAVNFSAFRGGVTITTNPKDGSASAGTITFTFRGASGSGAVFLTNKGNSNFFRLRATLAGEISLHVWSSQASKWVSL